MPSYGLSATVADSALDDMVGTNANDVQMHTGAPGAAGTGNVSSVTTREAVTWGSASGGSVAASNEPEWTNWAGTDPETVTGLSFWSASTSWDVRFLDAARLQRHDAHWRLADPDLDRDLHPARKLSRRSWHDVCRGRLAVHLGQRRQSCSRRTG